MAPDRVDYLELFTADGGQTVDYFVSSFGFDVVAEAGPHTGRADRRSVLLRGGATHLVVSSPHGAGGQVAAFLDRHGDGVADVALSCADVATTYQSAAAHSGAGLMPPRTVRCGDSETVVARVPGFGDCVHTLVQRRPGAATALPPGPFAPVAKPGPARQAYAVDHVAVCVPAGSLQPTADYYQNGLGLYRYFTEYLEVGDQAMDSLVVRSRSGGVTFTLLEPDTTRGPGQIDDFLRANAGAGVQHVAFAVADIVDSVRRLRLRGVEFLHTPAAYYDALHDRIGDLADPVADLRETHVLVDRDESGHLLQIFTRSPYPRGTLFFELIQRCGAEGFGSGNIRALYEAVERERASIRVT